ncbi:hypothetical protein D915_004195 [Fasciola hepatica]|uniref:WW domain-containing protein n=1 Tax=Fasciola hepatica TaxID=6192 RepID=A0A4E0RF14_FASHE|nr:hypothetical protein D915_004195 [Fasciola hepatica]
MEGYNPRKPPSVRVTVLEDPNNSLQELFNPASQKNSIPLIQRKLPKSFFVPPSGAQEPVHVSQFTSMQTADPVSSELVVSHSKTNSSPACLDSAICANFVSSAPAHGHQKSLDIAAKYNHGYAFDNICSTGFLPGSSENQDNAHTSCIKLEYEISELPAEFELAINENKQVYFLNHQTQATTWFDPRIPEEFQKWGMTIEELQQVHINYACQFPCGSPASLGLHGAQATGSASSPCPGPVASVGVGRGPGCLPVSVSPAISAVSPVNSSALTPGLAVLCSVSSASPISSNASVGSASSRVRMTGHSVPQAKHRTHVSQLGHNQGHKREQPVQAEIQHQRQHSHGHPTASQVGMDSLVAHFRSCSQPVSMSTGHDTIGVSGLANLSGAVTQSPSNVSRGPLVSATCGLSASSSLVGLSVASSPALQNAQLSAGNTVSSSSGQLVQGLECLRLNTSSSPGIALGSPGHVMDVKQQQQSQPQSQQQQQPKQQRIHNPQFMLQTNTGLGVSPLAAGTPPVGCSRFTGAVMPNTPVSGTQHSHQGSMDSGVGPSLAGQSTASSNQTPEYTIMLFCDPSLSECGAENMEGIAYPNEEFGMAAYNVFDNIDISDISA